MQLFPAAVPLEFVTMDLLGPFPNSKKGNVSVLVITECFSKLGRAVPMRTTTAAAVTDALLENFGSPVPNPEVPADRQRHSICKQTVRKLGGSTGHAALHQNGLPPAV